MAIAEKLLKFKYHFIVATVVSILLLLLIFLAPRILTFLAYFWPLFISTALFLVTVVFFRRVTPPAAEASGEKTGEELLDYVAGQPDQAEEPRKSEEPQKSE